jgi:hypothetical protein
MMVEDRTRSLKRIAQSNMMLFFSLSISKSPKDGSKQNKAKVQAKTEFSGPISEQPKI